VQRNCDIAIQWMQFLIHLSKFVDGKEIAECFAKGHGGCMTFCIMLIAYLHPSTEGLVYEFFKNILCDSSGSIMEMKEIGPLARLTYFVIEERCRPRDGICSNASCLVLRGGFIKNTLLGLGELATSLKFRQSMQNNPTSTVSKLKAISALSEKSASELIASLPN
jgi:hypothetical protein